MRTPTLFLHIATWSQTKLRAVGVLALLTALVGILTDRFVGGFVAAKAGQVQALFLFVFFTFLIVSLLYKQYNARITTVLEWWPMAVLRIAIFIVVLVLGVFCVGFTAVNVFSNAG